MDRGGRVLPISITVLKGKTEIAPRGVGRLLAFKDTVARRKPSWEEE